MRALLAAASDIKLHHSVFALPFALLGACLASVDGSGVPWSSLTGRLALVVACMVSARTAAMLANRILDAGIDARNPRTAGRAIPSGRLGMRAAIGMLVASSALFGAGAFLFDAWFGNPWPMRLALPVLAWLLAYPWIKRHSWMCHAWLGASLAMSVPAAALAVRPEALAMPAVWWLSGMVLLWVTGFDVIYALQDVEVDRREGLWSMPSRLGVERALMLSLAMHASAVGCLVAAARAEPRLGTWFWAAIGLVTALLVVEHATVRRWGTSRMALTFFTLNGCVSIVLGSAGILGLAGVGR
jgi:4-hydroxybenzoate polyprenyltransferase